MEPRSESNEEDDAEIKTNEKEMAPTSIRGPPNAFEVLMSIRPSRANAEKMPYAEEPVDENVKAAAKENKKLLREKLEKMSETKNKKRLIEDDSESREIVKSRVKKRVIRTVSDSDSESDLQKNKYSKIESEGATRPTENVTISPTGIVQSKSKRKRVKKKPILTQSDSDNEFKDSPVKTAKSSKPRPNHNVDRARQTLLKLEPVSTEALTEDNPKKRNSLFNYFNTVSKEEFDSSRDKIKVSAHIHSPPCTPGRKSIPPEMKGTATPRRSTRTQLRFMSCDQIDLLDSEIIDDPEPVVQAEKDSIFHTRPTAVKSNKIKSEKTPIEVSDCAMTKENENNQIMKTRLKEKKETPQARPTSSSKNCKDSIERPSVDVCLVENSSGDSDPKIIKDKEARKEKQKSQVDKAPKGKGSVCKAAVDNGPSNEEIAKKGSTPGPAPLKSPQKKKEQPAYLKGLKLRIKFPSSDSSSRTVANNISDDDDVTDFISPSVKTSCKSQGKIINFVKIVTNTEREKECTSKPEEKTVAPVKSCQQNPGEDPSVDLQALSSLQESKEKDVQDVDMIDVSKSTPNEEDRKVSVTLTTPVNITGNSCDNSDVKIVNGIETGKGKREIQATPVEGNAEIIDDEKSKAVKKSKATPVCVQSPQKKKEQPTYLKGLKLRIKFPNSDAPVSTASKNISDCDDDDSEPEDKMKTPTKPNAKQNQSSNKKRLKLSASKVKTAASKSTPLKEPRTPRKESSHGTFRITKEKSGKPTKGSKVKTPTKTRSPLIVKSPIKSRTPTKSKTPGIASASTKAKSSVKAINKSKSSNRINSPKALCTKVGVNSPTVSKTSDKTSSKTNAILSQAKSLTKEKSISTPSGKSSAKVKTLKRLTTPTKDNTRSKRSKLSSPVKTNSLTKLMSAAKEIALAKAAKSKRSQATAASNKSNSLSKSKSEASSCPVRQSPRKVISSRLTDKSSSKERKKPKSKGKPTSKNDKFVKRVIAPDKYKHRIIVSDDDDDTDDYKDSDDDDPEDSDVEVIAVKSKSTAVKKAPSKLAPLFAKTKSTPNVPVPEKVVDPKVLAARLRFLNSGVPDCVRKTMELITVEEPELSVFPEISHVQQKDASSVWHLPAAELTLFPLTDFPISVPPPIELGVFTDRTELKRVFNQPRPPSHFEEYRKVLNKLKISNPDYCVFRSFKRLRNKCRKTKAVQAVKAVEGKKAKRLSKRKRSDRSVEIIEEVKPAEDVAQVWTDKYKPMSSDEVVGNADSVQKLKTWLESWKKFRNCDDPKYDKIKRNRSLSGSSDEFINDSFSEEEDESNMPINTALIFGPCGSGKTSAVYAIANELGFKVLEMNASSKRTGKCLSKLQEATQSHRLCAEATDQKESCAKLFKTSAKAKKRKQKKPEPVADGDNNVRMSLILVENADIVFDDVDEGFIAALTALSQTSKRPLVIVANDPDCGHLSRFHEHSLVVEFVAPDLSPAAAVWLQLVCLVEGVNVGRPAIERLLKVYRGDIGRCLLQLQFWVLTGGNNLAGDAARTAPAPRKQSDVIVDDDESNMSWASTTDDAERSSPEHDKCIEAFSGNASDAAGTPYPVDLTGVWWNLAPMLGLPQVVPSRRVVVESSAKPRNNNCVDEIMADINDDEVFDIFDRLKRKGKVDKIAVDERKVNGVKDEDGDETKVETVPRVAEWRSACSREDLASLAALADDLAWMDVISCGARLDEDHAGARHRLCSRVWETACADGVSVAQDARPCRAREEDTAREIVHWVTGNSVARCARQIAGKAARDYDITLPDQDNFRWLHDQWRADNTVVSLVPANTLLNHPAILTAYSPFLRSVCRSENRRLAANTKRKNRFFHYLRHFGLHPDDATLNVLCATFDAGGAWKCADAE